MTQNTKDLLLYIASSSFRFVDDPQAGDDTGIFVVRLSLDSGAMEIVDTVRDIPSSQYMTISPNRNHFYATYLERPADKGKSSWICAFSLDSTTGQVQYLNRQAGDGDSPCHVSTDQTGRWVLSVSYTGVDDRGSVCVFPVLADGSLGARTTYLQHEGSGVNPDRQQASHPHMIVTDPTNQLVLVPDLGIDKVMVYRLDHETGTLTPHDVPWLRLADGAGPRHLVFHPNGQFLYVINELNSTVTSFRYDAAQGTFEPLETVSTIPDDFTANNQCANIHIEPSGRFLYGSNRGHNSIVIYAIDSETGRLELVGFESTLGEWPRGFAIDPTGTMLIAANQNSDDVRTFRIDPLHGTLSATGFKLDIGGPICIKPLLLDI